MNPFLIALCSAALATANAAGMSTFAAGAGQLGALIWGEDPLSPLAKTAVDRETGEVDANDLVDITTLLWEALFGGFIPSANPEKCLLVGEEPAEGCRFSIAAPEVRYQGEPRQIREELHFWIKTDPSGTYGKFAQRSFLLGRDGLERQVQMVHGDWEIGVQCQEYVDSAVLLNALKLTGRGFFDYQVDESMPPFVDATNEFEVDDQEVVEFYNPTRMTKLFVVYMECGNTLVIRSRKLPDGTSPEIRVMENSAYFAGTECTPSPEEPPGIVAGYLVKGQEVRFEEFAAHQQEVDLQIEEHGHYYGDDVHHYHDHAAEDHNHGQADEDPPSPANAAGVIPDPAHPAHVHNPDGTHRHIPLEPSPTVVPSTSWGLLKGYFVP